jgi:hypothetical protein
MRRSTLNTNCFLVILVLSAFVNLFGIQTLAFAEVEKDLLTVDAQTEAEIAQRTAHLKAPQNDHDHQGLTQEQMKLHDKIHKASDETTAKCEKLKKTYKAFDSYRLGSLYFCMSYAYINMTDDFASALHFAYRIYKVDPTDTDVVTTIIGCHWARYNNPWGFIKNGEELDDLNKAVAIAVDASENAENNANPEFQWEVGKALVAAGRYYNTKTKVREIRAPLITVARDRFYALEKMPNATDAQKIKAQLMLGHMNRWLGKNDTAALWYQRALTLDPTNKTAQVHLALVSR